MKKPDSGGRAMQITMSEDYKNKMAENDIERLRQLQLKEADLLRDFAHRLDEQGIKYYLAFGTLLGAVRHQGFIPWDDDVDVFVPRPDYDRLLQNADRVIGDEYLLVYNDEEKFPVWFNQFAGVEAPRVKVLKNRGAHIEAQNVRIDVFPLDGLPEGKWRQKLLFSRLKILHYLRIIGSIYITSIDFGKKRSFLKKVCIWIIFDLKLGKCFPPHKLMDRMDKIIKKYPYGSSKDVYGLTFDYNWKRLVCPKEWFGEGVEVMFEGSLFHIPADSHNVLTKCYGDYMTMPPEDKRVLKHIVGFVDDDSAK